MKASSHYCGQCGAGWSYAASSIQPPWQANWSAEDWRQSASPRRKQNWEWTDGPKGGKGRGGGRSPRRKPGKEGKGKQGKDGKGSGPAAPAIEPAPAVPSLQALAKPPVANMPPPPAMPGTPSTSSGTEGTLQQILLALNRNRDDLPQPVRDILDSQIQEDTKAQAKSLHRLVAAQGAARRQLAATRAARQDFVREWAGYVSGLCEMWKKQQEEKSQALAKFLEAEAQWEQQLAETTAQIAKAATDPDGTEMIDLEEEAMDEEETKISELAQAEVQRQMLVDNMKEADRKIADSLQAAVDSAQRDALELGRPDRERSPRRRTVETPLKDKAAKSTDAAGAGQQPAPGGGAAKPHPQ